MKKTIVTMLIALALPAIVPAPGEARVVRLVVEQKRPVAAGKGYGNVGPYERLDGTVYIEVDPRDPLNAVIVNLDKVPRTPKGMVGFTAPFFIMKPVDMARGNRRLFYDWGNRGHIRRIAEGTARIIRDDAAFAAILDGKWHWKGLQEPIGTPRYQFHLSDDPDFG